jgi:hypothetical protein
MLDSSWLQLLDSGMVACSSAEDEVPNILIWSLWGDLVGTVRWVLAYAKVVTEGHSTKRYSLLMTRGFTRVVYRGARSEDGAQGESRKRRRSAELEPIMSGGGWRVLGLGMASALVRSPQGVVTVWDLQHGVPLGQGPLLLLPQGSSSEHVRYAMSRHAT